MEKEKYKLTQRESNFLKLNRCKEINIISYNALIYLLNLYLEIFEEEDCDYPDRRKIAPKERAIERVIFNLPLTEKAQNILRDVVYRSVGLSTENIIYYLKQNNIKVLKGEIAWKKQV